MLFLFPLFLSLITLVRLYRIKFSLSLSLSLSLMSERKELIVLLLLLLLLCHGFQAMDFAPERGNILVYYTTPFHPSLCELVCVHITISRCLCVSLMSVIRLPSAPFPCILVCCCYCRSFKWLLYMFDSQYMG